MAVLQASFSSGRVRVASPEYMGVWAGVYYSSVRHKHQQELVPQCATLEAMSDASWRIAGTRSSSLICEAQGNKAHNSSAMYIPWCSHSTL
jgi:hypothetical protein